MFTRLLMVVSEAVKTDEVVRRRIAILILDRGILKHRFAKAAGRSASWVSMFMRGARPFPFEKIDEVAAFFQHTPEKLVAALSDEDVKRSTEALKKYRLSPRKRTVRPQVAEKRTASGRGAR